MVEAYKISGSLARKTIKELLKKRTIKTGLKSARLSIYTKSAKAAKQEAKEKAAKLPKVKVKAKVRKVKKTKSFNFESYQVHFFRKSSLFDFLFPTYTGITLGYVRPVLPANWLPNKIISG